MPNHRTSILLTTFAILALGCGGEGGLPNGNPGAFPFAGNWFGEEQFTNKSGAVSDKGFLTLHIDASGGVTGTMKRTSDNISVAVTGSLDQFHQLELNWQFPSQLRRTSKGVVVIEQAKLHPDSPDSASRVTDSSGDIGRLKFSLYPN